MWQECLWEHQLHPPFLSQEQRAEGRTEHPAESAEGSRWKYEAEPVSGQFIIRFRDYKMASDHKQALQDHLDKKQHWKFVDRNNPAARFPTDFALVEIDLEEADSIKVSRASKVTQMFKSHTVSSLFLMMH